jgi:hypothetical protein
MNAGIARCSAIVLVLASSGCGQSKDTTTTSAPPAAAAAPPTTSTAQPATPSSAAASSSTAVAPASAAVQPAPAAAADRVLGSQPYNQNPDLRCDVQEVRRVSGGALLIRWRVSRPAAPATGLAAGQDKGIYLGWGWDAVYYTDPAENKKYLGLKDSANSVLAQGENKTYGPGDQQTMWMKFPAPPPTSNKITFVFAGFPPFEDLPVS